MRDRGASLQIKPIKTMINHSTTEVFFDGPRAARRRADRRGGRGLSLHPRRDERRAHPDRRRVHRRRSLLRRPRRRLRERARTSSVGRSAPTRACSSRSRARTWRSRPPTSCAGKAAWLYDAGDARRRRGEHGEVPRLRGVVGGRQRARSTRTAASASRRSTTSSASSARRACTRRRRSPTTSCRPSSASTCSACRAPTERLPLRLPSAAGIREPRPAAPDP